MAMTRGAHYGQSFGGDDPSGNPFGDMGGGFGGNGMDSIMQFITGLLSHSGKPYADAEREYDRYTQPWSNAGTGARNAFTNRLDEMGNGENFYNNTMAGYNESPLARIQQQQAVRAGNAMGSESGLSGSTALTNYMQQNARDISSQDMQKYYNNRMGINNNYMTGQGRLMDYGHDSDTNAAGFHGNAAFGKTYAQGKDQNNIINGGAGVAQMLIKLIMGM